MIDPDGIQIQNSNLPSLISIKQVAPFETEVYNLEDDKDYEHYIKDIEKDVRKSFEYRAFIKYIRENMDMNKCSFLKGVSNEDTFDIKIEIHHYPFSLRDICEIVYKKRSFYNENLSVYMLSKEVMQLHYKLMVGLIPLSETVHEVTHSSRLFIPVDRVMGRYNLFIDYYKPFCNPEQLETLNRIENYTESHGDIYDTTILEENKVSYDIKDKNYLLPETKTITTSMIEQIDAIKANNYLLPTVADSERCIEAKKEITCPIYFE